MGTLIMSNPSDSRTKNFFASPALSLSLAGIFRDGSGTGIPEAVEEGDEGSCGGTLEISSENSGPVRSRSEDEFEENDEDYGEGEGEKGKKKKRKKYHRHTAEQIREMEALFKESPHPDEKQRQQLSKQLGLAPRQVKFWFQNRRTQIKAIQERHENSLLKSEIEKLRDQNKSMRETTIHKSSCPNCGFATSAKDTSQTADEHQLRIENAKLKSEVEKLRASFGESSPSSSCPVSKNPENRSSLDLYTGGFGLDRSRIVDVVNRAMEELMKMATVGSSLWVRSVETGREILNYDEYVKEFGVENSDGHKKRSVEASRETGVVFVDLPRLIQTFMDVNQWKEMFPCLISKAATVDVICSGEPRNRDGAVQLMFAELQMLTPTVATREVYFVRFCKQLSSDQWAIVDISIDRVEDTIDASMAKCRKRPSGCIIQDKSNGHCKVIWVEHTECQKSSNVASMYRTIVNSGLAFGAKHWIATLQLQCERLVFFMATNVPTKDSTGVATLAGRKSILKLAQRMTSSFCHALGASSYHTWTKSSSKMGEDIRVASRKNLNDPSEPLGLILCMVSSVWLPVAPHVMFDFLRDESRRSEWDIMSNGGQVIAHLAKGQDRGNVVTIQSMKSKDSMWLVQDSCTNAYESMVVFAPVEIANLQSVMTGCDSTGVPLLASGFSILPDGVESRPVVITSKPEEKNAEGGCLVTVSFQIQANISPSAKLSAECVESVSALISCTLRRIRTSLQCEDG